MLLQGRIQKPVEALFEGELIEAVFGAWRQPFSTADIDEKAPLENAVFIFTSKVNRLGERSAPTGDLFGKRQDFMRLTPIALAIFATSSSSRNAH